MNYIPTDELIDRLEDISKMPYIDNQEDSDLVLTAIKRIESLSAQTDFLRYRLNMSEHVIGQLYLQTYEHDMQ